MASSSSNIGKVFIARLPWSVNRDGLRSYFSKWGDVSDSVVITDRATGRSKGFGFVTFSNPDVIENVLSEHHELEGRQVVVTKAKELSATQPAKQWRTTERATHQDE